MTKREFVRRLPYWDQVSFDELETQDEVDKELEKLATYQVLVNKRDLDDITDGAYSRFYSFYNNDYKKKKPR